MRGFKIIICQMITVSFDLTCVDVSLLTAIVSALNVLGQWVFFSATRSSPSTNSNGVRAPLLIYWLKLVPSKVAEIFRSLLGRTAILWHCAIPFRGKLAGHSPHRRNCWLVGDMQLQHFPHPTLWWFTVVKPCFFFSRIYRNFIVFIQANSLWKPKSVV